MVKIAVIGEGHLADATRWGVKDYHGGPSNPLGWTVFEADLIWFCVDTPVDEHDRPDVAFVEAQMLGLPSDKPILVSSQLPVGTHAKWQAKWPEAHLAVQPENVRKATTNHDFRNQDRIIVGTRWPDDISIITEALSPFTEKILFMSPESAEMVKHALNAFLAMEICFANEIADICKLVGADVRNVFEGFRSDRRVGDGPLNPGGPYTGGTLGRDVRVLNDLMGLDVSPLIWAIDASNKGSSLLPPGQGALVMTQQT